MYWTHIGLLNKGFLEPLKASVVKVGYIVNGLSKVATHSFFLPQFTSLPTYVMSQ